MGIMLNNWAVLPAPTQPGQVGGHEGVGHIVKLGPGVSESSSVKLGDRVGIKWVSRICETCEACLAGMDACCGDAVSLPSLTTYSFYIKCRGNFDMLICVFVFWYRKLVVITLPVRFSNMLLVLQTTSLLSRTDLIVRLLRRCCVRG